MTNTNEVQTLRPLECLSTATLQDMRAQLLLSIEARDIRAARVDSYFPVYADMPGVAEKSLAKVTAEIEARK